MRDPQPWSLNFRATKSRHFSSPKSISASPESAAAFKLNGAVYIANIPWFIKNRTFTAAEAVGYIMPESDPDIDDAQDLSVAQQLAQEITV